MKKCNFYGMEQISKMAQPNYSTVAAYKLNLYGHRTPTHNNAFDTTNISKKTSECCNRLTLTV
ncbi:hypothetical protein HanIR_Chr12g0601671 [Helianthus annuus]|nr:hypothetical protein HanIR_Chr12g0601671 [Helianthus annuus]